MGRIHVKILLLEELLNLRGDLPDQLIREDILQHFLVMLELLKFYHVQEITLVVQLLCLFVQRSCVLLITATDFHDDD